MKRRRTAIAFLGLLLVAAGGHALVAPPPPPPISGVVRHLEAPVAGVLVIFYNLGDSSLTRIRTAADGTFVLASAPAGVYELIAYKRGFEPALHRLWHQAATEQISAVSIALQRKYGRAAPAPAPATMWDLRDRLPSDVLRELEIEETGQKAGMAPAQTQAQAAAAAQAGNVSIARLLSNGEVSTMTDVANVSSSNSLSRAAVGLQGGLPNGWHYGISGDYAVVGKPDAADEITTGNAAGLALDVSPSAAESVRLSTRRNSLSFGDNPASMQAHAASWSRGAEEGHAESVAARYIEETNLYRATALGTTIFPLASRTWELVGRYNRAVTDEPGLFVAMTYRHREASVGPSGVGVQGAFFQSAPDADLSAGTSVRLTDQLEIGGGVVARYVGSASSAYGIAPALTARYAIGPATVYVRGLYRVAGSTEGVPTVMPRVASIEESQEPAATQYFAAGLEQRLGRDSKLQFEVSEQRMGELVRAFFQGDFLTDFESVYLLDGNSVRQYKASVQQRLSNTLAASIAVRYGQIDGEVSEQSAANYGITGNQGHYWSARASLELLPTRTGFAVVVRGIRQDLETPASVLSNDSSQLALSVAQDLSVIGLTPLGAAWKLLVAFERAQASTMSDRGEDAATANRLLGGVGVSF
jgi:hypothetical protein